VCLPSTQGSGERLSSRIVPGFGAGAVITTRATRSTSSSPSTGPPSYRGLTVHQRGMALAEIAHPDFRDELRAAAERASGGRSPLA
jgi:acyl-CoA hydrolase